jgi:TolB-like protein/class 3 adenylate cyclase/Tfp pilus assembly protein PilF
LRTEDISPEAKPDLQLEIAHLLLIDVVGYSKLLVNEQIESVQELNRIVRSTEGFQAAEKKGKLIRVPTGDGMALVFFRSPEEPVQCALEISKALKNSPHIHVRMGVHSGPVHQTTDVNDRVNVAGTGFNVAQRVMDCGDAGHILLSKHLADDLVQYRHWQPHLHDLGECEVKHGLRLHVVNLYKDGLGNSALPERLRRGKRWKQTTGAALGPVSAPGWRKWALLAAMLLSAGALAVSVSIFLRRMLPPAARSASELSAAGSISEKSIAVLPFENLSADKDNAFFADGVQDEILTDLAKIADLKVISRTSVMQYKTGVKRNLREIANALGVARLLEGSVQRAANRVRVSAQLIDARTDTHLWAEKYDRPIDDVFAIQSEIAKAIADQLQAKLSPREKAAIEQQPTTDLGAYDRYVRAKTLLAVSADARQGAYLYQAVRLLEQAVARDPRFLLAYCKLAFAHQELYYAGFDHSAGRLAQANEALKQALELGPDRGEAHLAAVWIYYHCYFDYDRARTELAIARSALPNEPEVFALAGYMDRRQGHWKEHIQNLERAAQVDPRNVEVLHNLAQGYELLRQFPDMAAVLDRTLAITPADAFIRVRRASVDLQWHADTNRLHTTIHDVIAEDPNAGAAIAHEWFDLALCEHNPAEIQSALASIPREGITWVMVRLCRPFLEGLAARTCGDATTANNAFIAARAEMEKILQEQSDYPQALCVLGMIDAALGRKEDALREARRAVEVLPPEKDPFTHAELIKYLAVVYAWTGENEAALNELKAVLQIPGRISYGQLRLHPYWDPLRRDPRFDKLVAESAKPVAIK